MRLLLALLTLFTVLAGAPHPSADPAEAEREAIMQPGLDYVESWYHGNPELLERALHPDLAKRIVRTDAQGRSRLDHMGAMALVQIVRAGHGKNTPKEQQIKDVKILDRFGNAAVLRVEMRNWVDYLSVAKYNGRWVIVNVLWEMKPEVR